MSQELKLNFRLSPEERLAIGYCAKYTLNLCLLNDLMYSNSDYYRTRLISIIETATICRSGVNLLLTFHMYGALYIPPYNPSDMPVDFSPNPSHFEWKIENGIGHALNFQAYTFPCPDFWHYN